MIWPLTSMTAGGLMLFSWLFFVVSVGFIAYASTDPTLDQVAIGVLAVATAVFYCLLQFYVFIKMFACSCACNNCP